MRSHPQREESPERPSHKPEMARGDEHAEEELLFPQYEANMMDFGSPLCKDRTELQGVPVEPAGAGMRHLHS
eukprot:492755-Karenia_brevis.AAC.1